MRSTKTAVVAIALTVSATRGGAQTVRGAVVDRGGAPVPGVVVQVLDSTAEVARALTNDRGAFRVAAPRAGTYRLRAMRIGYRPVTTEPVSLRLGEEITKQLILSNVLVALDTIRVTDKSSCRGFTDSAAATFAVWEQVRTALAATQLTAAAKAIAATTVAFERSLDQNGRRVLKQSTTVSADYVKQPWRTISPELLRRDGYVVTTKDNVTNYYAPGLDMLLSAGFVEDHCFRLTNDRNRLGIGFEPTPDRRKTPEIRGTMWLDRKSAELRSLEYRYANIPPEQADEARGEMEFSRLANGAWAITKWTIRMPVLENRVTSQAFGGGGGLRLTGIELTGGELALVRVGSDTVWSRPALVMSGIIVDSASKKPVDAAEIDLSGTGLRATSDNRGRFQISNILPGEYTAAVHTRSLDSISTAYQTPVTFVDPDTPIEVRVPTASQLESTICGGKQLPAPGVVLGTATVVGDTALTHSVSVVAEWNEPGVTDSPGRRIETRADSHGLFRLCGVPLNTTLAIRASSSGATSSGVTAKITPPNHFLRVALVVDRNAPVATLAASEDKPGQKKAVTLDSVVVREKAVDPRLREYEDNRRLGLGQFFTRADLEKRSSSQIDDILQDLRGVVLIRGAQANAYLATKRQVNFCPAKDTECMIRHRIVWVPGNGFNTHPGAALACYAQIWLDNQLMNPEHPAEPFDLRGLNPSAMESVEYYDGVTNTPSRYSRQGSECGVLVIHTRRS